MEWGQQVSGAKTTVNRSYDAPANEVIEVRQTYNFPAGIPGLTEGLIIESIRSSMPEGATLLYVKVTIDWIRFQTYVTYQYRSSGLLVELVILAIIAILIVIGLGLVNELIYKLSPQAISTAILLWAGALTITAITGLILALKK